MPNIMAGSLGGTFPELSTRGLEVMSVVINNACNLSCKHCYLEAPRYEERHLDHDEWMKFFASVFEDVVPSVLCFAGKEPFLNEKSAQLVTETVRLRDRLQSLVPAVDPVAGVSLLGHVPNGPGRDMNAVVRTPRERLPIVSRPGVGCRGSGPTPAGDDGGVDLLLEPFEVVRALGDPRRHQHPDRPADGDVRLVERRLGNDDELSRRGHNESWDPPQGFKSSRARLQGLYLSGKPDDRHTGLLLRQTRDRLTGRGYMDPLQESRVRRLDGRGV